MPMRSPHVAVVQVLVLVAQDGHLGTVGQFVDALEFGQRGGLDVLVGQRQQRHLQADQLRRALGPQNPAQETTMSAGITPADGLDAGDLAARTGRCR